MASLPDSAQYDDWCRRIRDSEKKAFEELFNATSGALFRYAFRFTRHVPLAEDIVQEAFLSIWLKRADLDPGRSLRALLYVTVRHLALSQERSIAKQKALLHTMDKPDVLPTPEEATRARILGDRIREWIDELPARRREAFQLSRFDGLSYEEIANVMGLSIKTVDNHIWKALRQLRRRIEACDLDLILP